MAEVYYDIIISEVIFNMNDQPEYLGNIKVVQKVKYIGIEIDNKINYFKTQRDKIIQKYREMVNIQNELQKIENSVYKSILGAAHYSPNVTLGGEIGAPPVKKESYKWDNK